MDLNLLQDQVKKRRKNLIRKFVRRKTVKKNIPLKYFYPLFRVLGDATVRIWDLNTETPRYTLKGHTGWVLSIAWSPDGKTLASGSMDKTVRLWDPKTGKSLGDGLKGHTKWITSLSWEPYHL